MSDIFVQIDHSESGGAAALLNDPWGQGEYERVRRWSWPKEQLVHAEIGKIRNKSLQLTLKRAPDDSLTGDWTFSWEELVGPFRLDASAVVSVALVDGAGLDLEDHRLWGFMGQCGGWRTQSLQGALKTAPSFAAARGIKIFTTGNAGATRC